jgi:stearoyl-CoA desaturase (delta-9 desaturase)
MLCYDAHDFIVQEQSVKRPLVLIAGFIHDVADFMDEHPGGRHLIAKYIGKDATTAFFGGVYDHSNAAHNVSIPHCPRRGPCSRIISCSP